MLLRGTGVLSRCFEGGAGYMGGYMHGGGGFLMILGALALIALIVIAVVTLVKQARRRHEGGHTDSSLELLNDRYVKGEITEEEYVRMKKVIKEK
ncbi:SHOCT domain-containing protein [Papillibacter cinnamivorans]|uniref:Putative membrane protein n=1 Tax=Papillibacter cinnamivorans DSM 12816 TaxID=1122930 RepID=A0A1W1YIE9_9FIRM|nr:SHOCT domain-containing protein [Papillibacter cinnamivorans]SMC35913.1 putative membrane protein [Papillibacter cinnamivorans DSM 12816]